MSAWPDGRRAALSVTVDNLGEAAEIQIGLRSPDDPLGDHYSVTTALPIVLEELAAADLRATFFVEGMNAEVYPDALRGIAAAGHEVGFHAWRHEEWGGLGTGDEEANLDRGVAALEEIGLRPAGFRPPGGVLGDRTLELLRDRDFTYCSPSGSRAGLDAVAVLPFTWPGVDVFHVIDPFAALREQVTGSREAGGPDAVREAFLAALSGTLEAGGHTALVLHNWMIEGERDAVRDVLAEIRSQVDAGDLWVARCDEVACWMATHPDDFPDPPAIDPTSWADPG